MKIKYLALLFIHSSLILGTNQKLNYTIRKATMLDQDNLFILYKRTAAIEGFLARSEDEITHEYIHELLYNSIHNGLALIVEYNHMIIGSMIKYRFPFKACPHVFTDGSILIDPDFQRKGIGADLISTFLKEVEDNYPTILRVEIITRESSPAIKLYERLGFKKEGYFEKRIIGINNQLEAGIPMVWLNPNFKQ